MISATVVMSAVAVAPARERGLKFLLAIAITTLQRRSREGAWIEIFSPSPKCNLLSVAPARERGLK